MPKRGFILIVLSAIGRLYATQAINEARDGSVGNEAGSMVLPYPLLMRPVGLVTLPLSLAAIILLAVDLFACVRTK